jgi:hypothetical protein
MTDTATMVLERLRGRVMRPLAVATGTNPTGFSAADPALLARTVLAGAIRLPESALEELATLLSRPRPHVVPAPEPAAAKNGGLPPRLTVDHELPTMASMQPERRLLVAVLHDAILSFTKYRRCLSVRGRRLFAEVEAWFASDDGSWLFSFVNICETLGVSAQRIRAALSERTGR